LDFGEDRLESEDSEEESGLHVHDDSGDVEGQKEEIELQDEVHEEAELGCVEFKKEITSV
jgi:hypothetical protein